MINETVSFPCIKVEQPIGEFYLGAIHAEDLLAISYADVRRIGDRDVERYLGIQRPLDPNRVMEIRAYVNHKDSTFPTGVILAIKGEDVEYTDGKMKIRRDEGVAKILDGQHRIDGLSNYSGPIFAVPVVIFIDIDIAEQANIFSTINLAQTKVNRSLVYDLYEYAKSRSPQKTGHDICVLLNQVDDSPFKGRIKVLGVAGPDRTETITQAMFVENLLRYITPNAASDRDALMRGRPLSKADARQSQRYVFRNLFVNEQDGVIAKILYDFFSVVSTKWPISWNTLERGNLLNRSTGFIALMRFLRPCYLSLEQRNEQINQSGFGIIFTDITLSEGTFTPENYSPGSSGQKKLYDELMTQAGFVNSPQLNLNFE